MAAAPLLIRPLASAALFLSPLLIIILAHSAGWAQQRKGVAVHSIGVIVNASEKAHLEETLRSLLEITAKYDLNIGEIYVLAEKGGVPPSMKTSDEIHLALRGATLRTNSRLPARFQVTLSPTWILRVKEGQNPLGEVVLEGFKRPQKFLNEKGEFTKLEFSAGKGKSPEIK